MRKLVSGEVHVHYSQIYVVSDEEGLGPDLEDAFAGQDGGLCGAARPGSLFLTTGLHTGNVGFTVELHEDRPPTDGTWEEIVEASFTPASASTVLLEWGGSADELDLEEIDYRVRYCAAGMDEGRAADTRADGKPQLDRYLLQFWPSPPEPARVVKQTSAVAAYWHQWADELPPPPPLPPPLTPEEEEEDNRRAKLEYEQYLHQQRLAAAEERWGGQLPSEQLRHVGGNVLGMVALDRDLAEAVAAAGPDLQRAIVRRAAHRVCALAGLTDLEWVASALGSLDRGEALPPPFDDRTQVWRRLGSDERVPRTTVVSPEGDRRNISQQHMALWCLLDTTADDPLQAALDAIYAGAHAFGSDYRTLLDEVWGMLPATSRPLS